MVTLADIGQQGRCRATGVAGDTDAGAGVDIDAINGKLLRSPAPGQQAREG
jgi:hypothetical protein